MDRSALIARKHEVRRQLQRVQAELARLDSGQLEGVQSKSADDSKRNRRRIAELQQQVERLMAEEYNLRLAIDRTSDR